jgi:Protein of Unknown function (DUF2784)
MTNQYWFAVLADFVLVIHFAFALFVVIGLILVFAGYWRGWTWVRNTWFRWAHLLAIAIVVAESWLGIVCPLTELEHWLRAHAGQAHYAGDFIAHWVSRLLFYQAPNWVFALCYSLFGALVIFSWLLVPPSSIFIKRQ